MPSQTKQEVFVGTVGAVHDRGPDAAMVLIDVLLSTSTAVTSAASGRRTLLAQSVDEGRRRAQPLTNPILAAEPGFADAGEFDSETGPARLAAMTDMARDLVLVAPGGQSSGDESPSAYLACLRNMTATAAGLAERHQRVYLVPVGHEGHQRCEDQMVAAWIARTMIELGFVPGDLRTAREIERWSRADLSVLALGRGADYLRRLGRDADLDFVLSKIDDVDMVCRLRSAELFVQVATPTVRVIPSAAAV
jgi:phosphosulfolactate phosphohydrolase-like enzyme